MHLDYPTLRIIWWVLVGILLMGFAVMDGFDLGIGTLLPYVSRTNDERRVILNVIGPTWEGNQVWLVLGAGAIFAAWPMVYAITFSGFYFAMLLILLALILRPVGFKYRAKIDHTGWRKLWDSCLFLGGFLPAFLFGAALGDVLQGVPFYFSDTLRDFYTGSFSSLLDPFALLCGCVSVAMLIMHGGNYLGIKTDGIVQIRAARAAKIGAIFYILLFALAGYWIAHYVNGYLVTSTLNPAEPSNPLYKQVMVQTGAWLHNYQQYPLTILAPAIGFIGALFAWLFSVVRYYHCAWIASACSIIGTLATFGVSMFPFILPSSTHPAMSLLVWDSSSSQTTLLIMLIASAIFLPLIILYTSWVYYIMRGKIKTESIIQNSKDYY